MMMSGVCSVCARREVSYGPSITRAGERYDGGDVDAQFAAAFAAAGHSPASCDANGHLMLSGDKVHEVSMTCQVYGAHESVGVGQGSDRAMPPTKAWVHAIPSTDAERSMYLTSPLADVWDIDARLAELGEIACLPIPSSPGASTLSDGTTRVEWDTARDFATAAVACGDAAAVASQSGGVPPPPVYRGSRGVVMAKLAEESYAIPDILPLDPPPYTDPHPSSAYLEGAQGPNSCVRDGQGKVIMWPWETPNACFQGAGYAIPKQQKVAHRTDALRMLGMNASMASGNMGEGQTGVKAWKQFCAQEGTTHDRPLDPNSPLWVKLQEELLAMQFCCALVKDRGVQVSTATCYFGQVQGWHHKEHGIKLAAGLKLGRLPAMLKGLRRVLGEAPRAIRRGIAPQALGRAMDITLDPRIPSHANIRAALAVALQGLLRSAEFACDPGVTFQPPKHLTRADIKECSAERLVMMMLPCKNMRHLNGKTCPLVIGAGGMYVDAVREVRNMLDVDPVAPSAAAHTPMFRVPSTNSPLRTNDLRDLLRVLMTRVGETEPHQFGTHSLRIGGATALFAAGADETVIRTMGRWSSDCYRLYVRACFQQTLKWSSLARSTLVSDLAGEFDEVDFY